MKRITKDVLVALTVGIIIVIGIICIIVGAVLISDALGQPEPDTSVSESKNTFDEKKRIDGTLYKISVEYDSDGEIVCYLYDEIELSVYKDTSSQSVSCVPINQTEYNKSDFNGAT